MSKNVETSYLGEAAEIPSEILNKLNYASRVITDICKGLYSKNRACYTADFPAFAVLDGKPVYFFSAREYNYIFNKYPQSLEEMMAGEFMLNKDKVKALVMASPGTETVRVDAGELDLIADKPGITYIKINTHNYRETLNDEQLRLAGWFYGWQKNFPKNMQWLNQDGIVETRIYLPDPAYVKERVPEGQAIGRLCRLTDRHLFFSVHAENSDVPLFIREVFDLWNQDKPRLSIQDHSYNTLSADEDAAAREMTDEREESMFRIIKKYRELRKKK